MSKYVIIKNFIINISVLTTELLEINKNSFLKYLFFNFNFV